MFELAMTSTRPRQILAIGLDQLDGITDFHGSVP
jgi:hypothetical protein